jgi:hypothetical protein
MASVLAALFGPGLHDRVLELGRLGNRHPFGEPAVMSVQAQPHPEAKQYYRWTASLAEVLTDLRRRFEGDLDQYLLFMVFVQAEMEHALSGWRRTSSGLNALSVAAACGIPRETARGKLRRLTAAGLLRVAPDGLHYLSNRADGLAEYQILTKIAGPTP